jgi:hypothetical protein
MTQSIRIFLTPPLAAALAVLLVAAAGSSPGRAEAEPGGPFALFSGSFRGGGAVTYSDGRSERLSCRARGDARDGGRSLSENIVCASDTYRLEIRSDVVARGTSVSGDWRESSRGVSGAVTGKIAGGRFSGVVNGGGFPASMSLRATGRSMSMMLVRKEGDVARVEIRMSR